MPWKRILPYGDSEAGDQSPESGQWSRRLLAAEDEMAKNS